MTPSIIDRAKGTPSANAYAHRFGSLLQAYQVVGYAPPVGVRRQELRRVAQRLYRELLQEIEQQIVRLGGRVDRVQRGATLWINCEFTACIVLARCHLNSIGRPYWDVRSGTDPTADIWVVARLDQDNRALFDYYLLPRIDRGRSRMSLAGHNALDLDGYRFDDLGYFYGMASRAGLRNLA